MVLLPIMGVHAGKLRKAEVFRDVVQTATPVTVTPLRRLGGPLYGRNRQRTGQKRTVTTGLVRGASDL